MPRTVTLTFEDGGQHVYNNVPDEVTPDAIAQRASTEFSGKKLTGIDGGKQSSRSMSIPDVPPQPAAPPEPSFMDKAKGAGETALSLFTGATGGAAGLVGGTLGGIAGSLATGKFGTPEGAQMAEDVAGEQARRFTYAPRTATGQEYTAKVSNALAPLAAVPPVELANAARLGGASMPQVRAATAPITTAISNSPEAELVRGGARMAAQAITPTVRPETARLAEKAQSLNIPLRPDMLTDNRFARMMGEALEKVPLSGSKDDARQIGFNRALGAEIGADRNAKRMTPDVFDSAISQSGEKIGEIAAKTPVPLDSNFGTTLTQRVLQSQRFDTADVAKIIGNYAEDLRNAASIDGVIPGEQFRKINSQIGRQMRGTQNGDLKMALGDLQDELHDALVRNISNPDDLAALTEARRQYAIAKTIEPLVAKSKSGDISPAGLMHAVTATKDKKSMMARGRSGDLGDLARIGQLFLKEPQSSGTAERAAVYGGLLGGAGYIEPFTASGILGGANLYNRAGPSLTKGILSRQ